MTRARYLELVVILGALTAFAPLSIDMYLPALPSLQRSLGTDTAAAQLTLATFFVGFALGQAFYGPITDRFGRKPPLYFSISLFVATSAGCALATSVEVLAGLRFLQATGACAGIVISQAMVRDLFNARQAPKVYAALMLVLGAAPMVAPTLGGSLLVWFDWRAIFWLLTGLGTLLLIVVATRLRETHERSRRRPLALGPILATYGHLLTNRRYLGYALSNGLAVAAMFAYIAGSPFVFIELFGLTPAHFGMLFGLNAIGLTLTAQLNTWLLRRIDGGQLLCWANALQAGMALVLLACGATGVGGVWGIVLPLFVVIASVGLVMPNAIVQAMEPHGAIAGSASALFGVMEFGLGAAASTLVSAIEAASVLPMVVPVVACAVTGLTVNLLLIGHRPAPVARPADAD